MSYLDSQSKTEIRDGMRIDWDVPITVDDGLVLRCDVYRPIEDGKYPVLMTYGPYGKYLLFQDLYASAWDLMAEKHPDVTAGSTNKYQNWEVVDPEKWVPEKYAIVRVDSRGCGRSPGVIDIWSAREAKDLHDCIEWGGVQEWSNGKVGLNGISYYAENQWQVAALQPSHLAAMCIWEGAADFYRDMGHHGGIFCNGFSRTWSEMQVYTVQHGLGERGFVSKMNGDLVSGPITLSPEELGANRNDFGDDVLANKLDTDEYWTSRMPDFSKINVPFLSTANWGGQGLHPRGNFEGYVRSASEEKWLEVHGIEHWTHFYTDYGREMQLKFFNHFLKGEDSGWEKQSKVFLQVRHVGEKFVPREENEWPLARTDWKKFYLDTSNYSLGEDSPSESSSASYDGFSDGLIFLTQPFEKETELTGPMASKLFISSETNDADFFLVVRLFSPDMKEITFVGAVDPHTPIAQGWLRASHRKLDEELTLPYRPYHTHDEIQPLNPGEIYELDIEIWPSCVVVPEGYRIGLSVRGKDYVYPGGHSGGLSNMKEPFTGVALFYHNDPKDRPPEIFGKKVTLHSGPEHKPYLLLPFVS